MKILKTWSGNKVRVPFTDKEWGKFIGSEEGEKIANGLHFLWDDGKPFFLQPPHKALAPGLLYPVLGAIGLSPERIEFISTGEVWHRHNESKRGDPDPWATLETSFTETLAEALLTKFHKSLIDAFIIEASWWNRGRRRKRLRRFQGMIKFIVEHSLERSLKGLRLPKRKALFESFPLILNSHGQPIPCGIKDHLKANLYAALYLELGFAAVGQRRMAETFKPFVELFRLGNHPLGLADEGKSYRLLTL